MRYIVCTLSALFLFVGCKAKKDAEKALAGLSAFGGDDYKHEVKGDGLPKEMRGTWYNPEYASRGDLDRSYKEINISSRAISGHLWCCGMKTLSGMGGTFEDDVYEFTAESDGQPCKGSVEKMGEDVMVTIKCKQRYGSPETHSVKGLKVAPPVTVRSKRERAPATASSGDDELDKAAGELGKALEEAASELDKAFGDVEGELDKAIEEAIDEAINEAFDL